LADHFVVMLEDTTARHEAEQAAAANLEMLDRLNRLKSEFLHSVSHEFKTALIGIQGFSEFMRDSDQLEISDVRTFASDIYRDAARLDRMVNEMLDLDRAESSRTTLRVVDVDMNALIRREVEQAQARATGIEFEVDFEAGLPPALGDGDRLAGVVRTLLDNAIKYSPENGRVTVTSVHAADSVEVVVADQGSAVRADFDNRLFGATDLYANNPIRKVVGTGLGLGMVRQVVEMHGGRIWVDRHEGSAGSEFHFTVPAAAGTKVA
jgi:signal transduction histidine kinase